MIYFTKEINAAPCSACGQKELNTRYIFKIGPMIDQGLELALCVPCKNQFYFPLKYGWQKGMDCRVVAKGYDRADQFKIVACYEELKAVKVKKVKNEEGKEFTVLLQQLEAW